MKRFFPWMSLLVLISLAACNLSARTVQPAEVLKTPTLSNEQMQTQIVDLLTLMPTNTGQPQGAGTPTLALPTVLVVTPTEVQGAVSTATPLPSATPAATDTPQPPAATATATTGAAATTAPTGPTFTPAPGDPRARLGTATSVDPMDSPSTWVWPTGFDKYSSASFGGGYQTITALTTTDGWRLANPLGREFTNLYLEGTFRVGTCTGSDHYGMIVRVPVVQQADQGYLFGVTCDGRYSLRRWDSQVGNSSQTGTKGEMKKLVDWTASPAIASGSNQVNRIGIMMVGSRLLLYANGQLLKEVQDTTFPSGYFGLFIGSTETKNFSVQVDEMSYWENPQP